MSPVDDAMGEPALTVAGGVRKGRYDTMLQSTYARRSIDDDGVYEAKG